MKKITLLALLALGLSFASCKKDRTCTCTGTITYAVTGGPFAGTNTETEASTVVLKEVDGKSARANCMSSTSTTPPFADGFGGTVNISQSSTCALD
jgi:hypothetical protein